MQARSESRQASSARPGIGTSLNLLLLGVLTGLLVGQSASAAQATFVMPLTLAGLGLSLAFSKLARYLMAQSKRKAFNRSVMELERRMERLIPKRHMKAHGMHSHSPHSVDESESNGMPVARRSQTMSRPR
ncbi:MAG TPA: hypothetical protein VMM76_24460 [Pirellulaceae bacterium]|nr:hypothetical protein [Pirellulaceae bacterium]